MLMFGLFKKKMSITECASSAEILPVAEDGDYKAFLIQVLASGKDFSSIVRSGGGRDAFTKFVEIIDERISSKDFENIFDVVDEMRVDFGDKPKLRNLNAERVVICKGEEGYIFRWAPSD